MAGFSNPLLLDHIPSIDEQRDIIKDKLLLNVASGQIWYMLDISWFNTFLDFVGLNVEKRQRAPHPGPINNALLIDETNTDLRPGLFPGIHFVFVSEEVWVLLVFWYGTVEGQIALPKKTYRCGAFMTQYKIDVYKIELFVYNNLELKDGTLKKFSRTDTIDVVKQILRDYFRIPHDYESRVWAILPDTEEPTVLDERSTLDQNGLDCRQHVILESKSREPHPETTRPRQNITIEFKPLEPPLPAHKVESMKIFDVARSSVASCSNERRSAPRPSSVTTRIQRRALAERRNQPCFPGICGLENLLNTCFMNTVIQCLSNIPPITNYFLSNKHLLDLNEDNPLGMRGLIAKSYGNLVHVLWSGRSSFTAPDEFKRVLGTFAPQFAGSLQHDVQELLTFLLDGLHEDVNLVTEKPYVEHKNKEWRPDDVVAEEAWQNYIRRNVSIIVDTFHGLLKSRVVCPICDTESITFDPFVHLSLPLPVNYDLQLKILYVPYHQAHQEVEFLVKIPVNGTFKDLCEKFGRIVGTEKLIFARVINSHFHTFFDENDSLSQLVEQDTLYVYDLPSNINDFPTIILPVVHCEASESGSATDWLTAYNSVFGVPFLIVLPKAPISYKKLYSLVTKRLLRHCPVIQDNMDMDLEENFLLDVNQALFELYLLSSFTFDCQNRVKIDFNETIHLNKLLGNETLILQWTHQTRMNAYKAIPVAIIDATIDYKPPPNVKLDISDCLNLFTTNEKLCAENTWYCPRCQLFLQASKKIDLWKMPKILIFHLKRFAFENSRREKLDMVVEFPIEGLNMEKYVVNTKDSTMYDLICVSNHYGTTGSGHCTAFAKNDINKKWYCFDDTRVTEVMPEQVVSSAAYVLFYMKREEKQQKDLPSTVTSETT